MTEAEYIKVCDRVRIEAAEDALREVVSNDPRIVNARLGLAEWLLDPENRITLEPTDG